jgi:hypothetical protein
VSERSAYSVHPSSFVVFPIHCPAIGYYIHYIHYIPAAALGYCYHCITPSILISI